MFKRPLKIIGKAVHLFEDGTLCLLILSLLGLSILQITMRNLGVSGFLWAESASRILVLWLAMFGAMRASRLQNHIAIDLLSHYGKGLFLKLSHFIVSIGAAIICAIVAYYSVEFIKLEYEDGATAFLNVPVWLCEAIIPFSLSVITLRFLFHSLTVPNDSNN